MKHKNFVIILIIAISAMITAKAQQGTWERLGTRTVDYGLDKDVIPVTWRDGAFDAIKFEVNGGALNMHKVIIHFENGSTQEVNTAHTFTKGNWSRTIDLAGNNRLIEKIVFWYDTKNFARKKAVITVFGHH